MRPQYLRDPSALSKLYVTGNTNTQGQTNSAGTSTVTQNSVQVPLSSFTRLIRETAPLSIAHQEQFPAATISFDLAPGEALGDAVTMIAAVVSVAMSAEFTIERPRLITPATWA